MREVIELFLERLPASVPFQILCHKVMERIDLIRDDDIAEFIRLTNDALDIDTLYRRTTPSRPLPASIQRTPTSSLPRVSPVPAVPATTVSLPVVASSRPRSTLVCSNTNCGASGHTIDTCFKTGGGLEGQRDQYMAKRKGAQAHLAQLDDFLAGRDCAQAFLTHLEEILECEDDPPDVLSVPNVAAHHNTDNVTDPVPTFSALSLGSSDVVVDSTSFVNDHLYFDAYSPSQPELFPAPLAFSAFPSALFDLAVPDLALGPSAFVATSLPFNSLLDSGCTHYIL
jgi:hypothetical protein